MPEGSEKLRLNQAISKTGYCSRRRADELIAAGRVRVNGQVCTNFGFYVDPEQDDLHVDGEKLWIQVFTYVALNKPPGIVTTMSDDQSRETVMDLLPESLGYLRPVGRLDLFSEGLLILTNDGELTQQLSHPSRHLPKTYHVTIRGVVSDAHLRQLSSGISLDDGMTAPARIKLLSRNKSYSEIEMVLIEGRNRQIRRMFSYLGYPVRRLVRVAIGGLQLGQIALGTWRYLNSQEVSALLSHNPTEKR